MLLESIQSLKDTNSIAISSIKASADQVSVLSLSNSFLAKKIRTQEKEIERLEMEASKKDGIISELKQRERTTLDYNQLRLDWINERTALVALKIEYENSEREYQRVAKLFNDQLVSESDYNKAKIDRDSYRVKVEETSSLVSLIEQALRESQDNDIPPPANALSPNKENIFVQATFKEFIKPEYPKSLFRRQKSGSVKLKLNIDKYGNVEEFSVLSSSHNDFISAVKKVVYDWKFNPAQKNGEEVRSVLTLPLEFK